MSYKTIAIQAAKLAKDQKISPLKAWQICAERQFPNSKDSQVKSCPKSAFLGLCEEGMISGIPAGSYCRSIDNKRYSVKAANILKNSKPNTYLPLDLWTEVLKGEMDKSKRHNSQMHVVLGLWEDGLLKR